MITFDSSPSYKATIELVSQFGLEQQLRFDIYYADPEAAKARPAWTKPCLLHDRTV